MNCLKCGSELDQDGDIDTAVIDSESCTHNFKSTNEDCRAHFEIEFHAVEINEVEYDGE